MTRLPSPTTNDLCSALALDACCMQRPMKRKVCWFLLCSSHWTLCLFPCLPGTLSHMNNSSLVHLFVSLIFLDGKAEYIHSLWSVRGGTGGRIRKCWVTVKGPTAHLCFFSSLHECVRPVDEGDQDGSLYFLLSRWCFACVFLPCCLSFLFTVRVP